MRLELMVHDLQPRKQDCPRHPCVEVEQGREIARNQRNHMSRLTSPIVSASLGSVRHAFHRSILFNPPTACRNILSFQFDYPSMAMVWWGFRY